MLSVPVMNMTEKVLVTLRDGRHLVGMMRSFDQYGEDESPCIFRCIFFFIMTKFSLYEGLFKARKILDVDSAEFVSIQEM